MNDFQIYLTATITQVTIRLVTDQWRRRMDNSRVDGNRVLLAATLLSGFIGLGIYLIVYLTLMRYGTLNANGQAYARVGLYVTAVTLFLSIYQALAAHSRALTTPALSGVGWFLIAAGLILAFLALGGTIGLSAVPGVTVFGGVAGAMFLIIAGSALLQAERNARERSEHN